MMKSLVFIGNMSLKYFELNSQNKVGCVFLMVGVSMLSHAEIGRNDRQEGAPYFINPFENLSKGFLEWELDRMHREAKKNALLAEAENEIMDVGDRNTQDGLCNNFIKYRFINS